MVARRNPTTLLLALGLLLGVGGPAVASNVPTLGADGEIYRVVKGTYGDLFPGGSAATATSPVLALDIDRPGVATERLLVPTTGDEFPEDSPAIILDPSSQTPFLVWEKWVNFIHPELNLVHLTPDGWSEVAELSGSPFRQKSSPTFAITHDSVLRPQAEGQLVPSERTVVHLVWLELSGEGTYSAQYTPVVIQDGAYVGWNPVFRLNDLISDVPAGAPSALPGLVQAIAVGSGSDDQSVNIVFADAASGRVATVTARALPRELTELSDSLGNSLAQHGGNFDPAAPECRPALADFVRHTATELGNRLQAGFVAAMADDLSHFVLDPEQSGPCDVESLADAVRVRVLDSGAKLIRSAVSPVADFMRHQAVELGNRLETGPTAHHQIQLGLLSARQVPATGGGKTSVMASRSGKNVLVAWEHDGLLSYRETRGEGWSSEFVLRPQSADGWIAAYQALRDRISDR
jgi:hypothetical protein